MKKLTLLFVLLVFFGCKEQEKKNEEKQVVPIVNAKSNIVLTLTDSINVKQNQFYTPSISLVWQEVKKQINNSFITTNNKDLKRFNNSESYKNALPDSLVKTTVNVQDNMLHVTSEFSLQIPFGVVYEKNNPPLQFNDTLVESFGSKDIEKLEGYFKPGNKSNHKKNIEILYYDDNTSFAIQLNPKNENYQIQLYKFPDTNFNSLQEMLVIGRNKALKMKRFLHKLEKYENKPSFSFDDILDLLKEFDISRQQMENLYIKKSDAFSVPSISFNAKRNYNEIIGATFNTNYKVNKAWQSINFKFNEKGAEVSSESRMVVESVSLNPSPKALFFDSDFLVVIKLKGAYNPCFVGWVVNTDIMEKRNQNETIHSGN